LTSAFRLNDAPPVEVGVYRRLRLRSAEAASRPTKTPWSASSVFNLELWNKGVVSAVVAQTRPDAVVVWNGGGLGRAFLSALGERTNVLIYLSDRWLRSLLYWQAHRERRVRSLGTIYTRVLRLLRFYVTAEAPSRLMFCSRALQKEYEQLMPGAAQATVVYHGVSTQLFPFRTQSINALDTSRPASILFAGRVCKEKGVETLLTGMVSLRKRSGLERTRLTIVGPIDNCEYQAYLRYRIKQLGLEDAVTLLPARPRAAMSSLYASHDVFVFPSEWSEPFALTLLEAMATGIPVITTTTGGSAEIARDGDNCLVFRAGDEEELAAKLAWALTNPRHASRIGLQACRLVATKYSLEGQVKAIDSCIHRAVGQFIPAAAASLA
jgi:glycogen(starch) synthase